MMEMPPLPKPYMFSEYRSIPPRPPAALYMDEQMRAYGESCARMAREEAAEKLIAVLLGQTELIAEFLYGHPRHKAVEWAKEDKFDSDANKADEILDLLAAAIRKG